MSEVRRLDSLERTVRDTRRAMEDAAATLFSRLGTHTHGAAAAPVAGDWGLVAAQETTTSTTYTNLATVGPSCSMVLPTARDVLVIVRSNLFQVSTVNRVFMSWEASGATTLAAADAQAVQHNGSGNDEQYASSWVLNCAAGTTTFTAKYRVGGTTGRFRDRMITAQAL